jgi:hypothetical protein
MMFSAWLMFQMRFDDLESSARANLNMRENTSLIMSATVLDTATLDGMM